MDFLRGIFRLSSWSLLAIILGVAVWRLLWGEPPWEGVAIAAGYCLIWVSGLTGGFILFCGEKL